MIIRHLRLLLFHLFGVLGGICHLFVLARESDVCGMACRASHG